MNSYCSFACANFIQTVATFGTDYVPTAKKNIGVYAGVLVAQGYFALLSLTGCEQGSQNFLQASSILLVSTS